MSSHDLPVHLLLGLLASLGDLPFKQYLYDRLRFYLAEAGVAVAKQTFKNGSNWNINPFFGVFSDRRELLIYAVEDTF